MRGPLPWLILSGALLSGASAFLALLSRSFALDFEGPAPIPLAVGVLIFASIVALLSLILGLRCNGNDRVVLSIVLLGAVLLRAPQIFAHPILEIDLYRYLWDGIVVNHGVSPYLYSPEQALAGDPQVADDPYQTVAAIARSSPSHWQIVSRVHFEQYTTIYPPVSQFFFACVTWLIPDNASVYWHVVGMKSMLVGFDLGTLCLLLAMIRRLGMHPAWALAYAWNPLVIKEIANSGHLDSIAVFFTTLACTSCVAFLSRELPRESPAPSSRWFKTGLGAVVAAVSLGLGVGAKLFPVVLVPLFAWVVFRHRRPCAKGNASAFSSAASSAVFLAIFCAVSAATLWPMLRDNPAVQAALGARNANRLAAAGPEFAEPQAAGTDPGDSVPLTMQEPPGPFGDAEEADSTTAPPISVRANSPVTAEPDGTQPTTLAEDVQSPARPSQEGLTSFLSRWRMNDAIFSLFFENARPQPGDGLASPDSPAVDRPWYLFLSESQRNSLSQSLRPYSENPPYLFARLVTLILFAAVYLWVLARTHRIIPPENPAAPQRIESARQFLNLSFLVVAMFFMLQPTQNPWYWVWAMPLVCFASNRGWLWVSAALLIYYSRFWFRELDGHFVVAGWTYTGTGLYDHVIGWLEHLSIWGALLVGYVCKRIFRTPGNA